MLMFRIAICDDEKKICEQLETFIAQYCEERQMEVFIKVYENGESLYDALDRNIIFDLIFLDIELYHINGIEIGQLVRDKLHNVLMQIVYISSKQGYAMDLFAVRPLNFLLKPLAYEQIAHCIDQTLELVKLPVAYFTYRIGKEVKRVPLSNILYFESNNRKVTVAKINGRDSFYGKLNSICQEVEDRGFLAIHKSYLVNYLHIESCRSTDVTMDNGEILPISRARQKAVAERLMHLRQGGKKA